ncbi:DUF4159 domain-containing protein [bacterium AH-315-P07]|nr:DUF4159 domain-containing protein [bacterium AH-315-P07]
MWHTHDVGAQRGRWGGDPWTRSAYTALEYPDRIVFPDNKFVFCRLRYTSRGEHPSTNIRGRWQIDYPDSDEHFSWRLSELTTLEVPTDVNGDFEHAVVQVGDENIFDYPFTYLIEPGWLEFTDKEVINLRRYLLRGGFLMVDDFWGEDEWINWEIEIGRVFDPLEYPIIDLELDHAIFHMVFDLDEKPQVPTPWDWARGRTSERFDADHANYRGIYDKAGRLMVVMCHNTDLGDGWEREGMYKGYFEEVSAKKAYPMGINIVVYAMTH